jgi:PTS system nitrogen regulatory IIA component
MRISDLLRPDLIDADLSGASRDDVIRELVRRLATAGVIGRSDEVELTAVLLERERQGSTGIGEGVAIPHGKYRRVRQMVCAFGVSRRGVDFSSVDAAPVHLVFLLVAPIDSAGPHLQAIGRISRMIRDPDLRRRLLAASNGKELLSLFQREDRKPDRPG